MKEDETKDKSDACNVAGCNCKGYDQPDVGFACKSCGHSEAHHAAE